jgi:hypothetical protein
MSVLYAFHVNFVPVLGNVSEDFVLELHELVSELRADLPEEVFSAPAVVEAATVSPGKVSQASEIHFSELISTIIQSFAVGGFGIFVAVRAQHSRKASAFKVSHVEAGTSRELDATPSQPSAASKPTPARVRGACPTSATPASSSAGGVQLDFGDALAALRRRELDKAETPVAVSGSTPSSSRVAAAVSGSTPSSRTTAIVEDWQRGNAVEGVSQRRDELPRARASELLRSTQRLLNKVCPENVATIVEQLADIKVNDGDELAFVSGVIFKRALRDPHYVETYADLFFGLNAVWPEFPPAVNANSPTTFLFVLLEKCRDEFEALPATFEATPEEQAAHEPEELEYMLKQRKDKMIAFMRLMGNLFLRGLLSTGALGAILRDLVCGGKASKLAGELEIECTCELLRSVGAALQNDQEGSHFVSRTCGQLAKLRKDGVAVYSKRIQFMMQDMIDLRDAHWVQKAFKNGARTKDDLRQEAACEEQLKHQGEDGVLTVVAGARPDCIAGTKVHWGEDEVVRTPAASSFTSIGTDRKSAINKDNPCHIPLPPGGSRKILGPSCATVQALQEETGARVWVDTKKYGSGHQGH